MIVALGEATGVTVTCAFVGVTEVDADGVASGLLSISACFAILSLDCSSNFTWAFFSSRCFCTTKNHIHTPSKTVMPKAIIISAIFVFDAPLLLSVDFESGVKLVDINSL